MAQCMTALADKVLWARGSVAHMEGWPDFKMAAPINVLVFSRQYHRRGANASV